MTGATGYIGGRLVPRLLGAGHEVVCLTRDPRSLRDVPWRERVAVFAGDVSRYDTLKAPMIGVDFAYYLVHSMTQRGFAAIDRSGAANFADVAHEAGVRRIVYLGGPEPAAGGRPSEHLRSRADVARILLDSGVPTIVLRAAVIIGSGSASFEMLRYLTERLPVMVTPRWVHNRVQPIAIRDVLLILVECANFEHLPPDTNRGFDLGGPDVLTYAEMMRGYAEVAGLRQRVIVPLRPLTPWLSAQWVGLVTPVPNAIARPLVGSLIHPAVARENDISWYIPSPSSGLMGFKESVRLSLAKIRDADVETRWSAATWSYGGVAPHDADPLPSDPDWSGGSVYTDRRERHVDATPERLWSIIEGIGGEHGWYSFPLAWSMRGWVDRAVGGVGLRRGRRDPNRVYVGEALDFWRVEEVSRSAFGGLLRLRAEMRLPGRAWLELKASPDPAMPERSIYEQRAVFLPKGLAGHAYWAAMRPFHSLVFGGMAENIEREAAGSSESAS